jgi:putative OmpL-like beta-barrel porin-2
MLSRSQPGPEAFSLVLGEGLLYDSLTKSLCLRYASPALLREASNRLMDYRIPLSFAPALLLASGALQLNAQSQSTSDDVQQLRRMVLDLEQRVGELEHENRTLRPPLTAPAESTGPLTAAALVRASEELRVPGSSSALQTQTISATPVAQAAPPLPGALPGGATLNYTFDGYYEYNFNDPIGRVNDLRAYDVLSNVFSINQADFIFDLDPDLTLHRRYGFRIDLQFGQATETLQGNPANETRPEIYRNIFQAYGSYIFPAGHGIDMDFGKWASSLGIEGNYTKDQQNYTRSYYFYYLPFYHNGIRTSYKFNDKFTANYWIDNGTNQSEPTNGYKDELFGFVLQPVKSVSWTFNYYNGQEHPDTVPATNCTVPVQPGLCLAPLTPAPNGKIHIFDSYATWQATPKLNFAIEGDYVIQRLWANAAPGESSAPSHVDGGVAYAQYQLNPKVALAARTEYLSDRGGLFSNQNQALKEATGTYKYNFADGFDAFLEYRRDWSNRLYFVTSNPTSPSSHQDTALLGVVWWYGGKQGSW